MVAMLSSWWAYRDGLIKPLLYYYVWLVMIFDDWCYSSWLFWLDIMSNLILLMTFDDCRFTIKCLKKAQALRSSTRTQWSSLSFPKLSLAARGSRGCALVERSVQRCPWQAFCFRNCSQAYRKLRRGSADSISLAILRRNTSLHFARSLSACKFALGLPHWLFQVKCQLSILHCW